MDHLPTDRLIWMLINSAKTRSDIDTYTHTHTRACMHVCMHTYLWEDGGERAAAERALHRSRGTVWGRLLFV
jgi:hypothetical protein